MENQIIKLDDITNDYRSVATTYLQRRGSDNPEFVAKFMETFSALIFSQSDDMIEKIKKTRPNSLLNAIHTATELEASFAKKEISIIPFEIYKKVKQGDVEKKVATGEYDLTVIHDIKAQKQLILNLENCKHFFTAEVHEGVEVCQNLATGNYDMIGKNDVNKETVGYYARFTDVSCEVYDLFMSCKEITDRASFSPGYDEKKYKQTRNNPHYEKIVVRNLMKIIPKVSKKIINSIAIETYTDYELIEDKQPKTSTLEEAKKELVQAQNAETIEQTEIAEQPKEVEEKEKFF